MASDDEHYSESDELDNARTNRFDWFNGVINETLGDQARDKFQAWCLEYVGDEELKDTDPLSLKSVESGTKCLLDIPYLWLKHGDALDLVSTFEGWLIAVFGCLDDMLRLSEYAWLVDLVRGDNHRVRLVAPELEGFNHPALQRSTFEMIQVRAQRRRDEQLHKTMR